jgi:hypothetical protein
MAHGLQAAAELTGDVGEPLTVEFGTLEASVRRVRKRPIPAASSKTARRSFPDATRSASTRPCSITL